MVNLTHRISQNLATMCIADTQEQGKPCPACGEKNFTLTKQISEENKRAIGLLQHEGEGMWLVRDTGAAGHSLGP